MRKVQIGRLLGLIGIAVTTSLVTATLFASQMKRAVKEASGPSGAVSITRKGDPTPRPSGRANPISVPTASGHLKNVAVKADGDVLIVSADAYLMENPPKYEYLWAIRVFDLADVGRTKPVYYWFYTENRWRMDPAGEMVAHFQDAFRLPVPRKLYRVEISVLLVAPGVNLAQLKDPAKADSWQGPASIRPVVVGQ